MEFSKVNIAGAYDGEVFRTISLYPTLAVSTYGRFYDMEKDKFMKISSSGHVTVTSSSHYVAKELAKNILCLVYHPDVTLTLDERRATLMSKFVITIDGNVKNLNLSNLCLLERWQIKDIKAMGCCTWQFMLQNT